MLWCPLRPAPLFALVFVVLSFFLWLFGWFRRRRSLSLSLSFFLRRWGNPNPFRGFGIPLVSLHRGHALRLRSVRPARSPSPRFPPRSCFCFLFFFFFLAALAWVFLWCFLAVVGLSVGLVFVGGVFLVVPSRCLHCMQDTSQMFRTGQGDKTSPAPVLIITMIIFGGLRVGTGIPCNHSGNTDSVSPPPPPSCRTL